MRTLASSSAPRPSSRFGAPCSRPAILPRMRLGHPLSYRHWQARLLMWGAAGAVGAAAVAFAKIADVAQWGLKRVIGIAPWTPWVLAPVGFFVIAWLTRRYFRGA